MVTVRTAEEKDADRILELLGEVLALHAEIRPDIFLPGTTKYKKEEICTLLHDPLRRSFVAVDEGDIVLGYALCECRRQEATSNRRAYTYLYVDDLCVDESARGQQVGRRLFEHVREEAKALGCYEVTLNVWQGNDGARAFYDKMGMKPQETTMELILD